MKSPYLSSGIRALAIIGLASLAQATYAVVGGSLAKNTNYSSVVEVETKLGDQYSYCTGFMVADRWALTSADCAVWFKNNKNLLKTKNIRVATGFNSTSNIKPRDQIQAAKLFLHPKFDVNSGIKHDLALIKLKKKPSKPFTKLAIPDQYIDQDLTRTGKKATVSGYGQSKQYDSTAIFVRRKLDMDILGTQTCRTKMKQANRGLFDDANPKNVLCAGRLNKAGEGACFGDGGAPIIGTYHGKQYALGVLAWLTEGPNGKGTKNCNRKDEASVFVRLSGYKKWINNTIRNN